MTKVKIEMTNALYEILGFIKENEPNDMSTTYWVHSIRVTDNLYSSAHQLNKFPIEDQIGKPKQLEWHISHESRGKLTLRHYNTSPPYLLEDVLNGLNWYLHGHFLEEGKEEIRNSMRNLLQIEKSSDY